MSVPKSRSYRFPKSRSKYFKEALKLAKGLPGYEKAKSHYQVSFGTTDDASDDLWKLVKISSRWKGSAFLIDGKEVEQDVWEKSFQDTGETHVEEKPEKAKEDEPKPEKPEKAKEDEPKPEKPEKAKEDKSKAEKPEKAKEDEPKPEKPEKAKEDEPKPEKPEKAKEDKSKAEKPEEKKKPEPRKPPVVQINPAPKPDNSGCGKKAAVLMLAAMMGILSFFR